ncbi:hypothetical protein AAW14_01625 [Streptomyces hygroscopicus]|uniref:hypothetical protein n=1 Tax=Streptomyces hygroscopicus TaxID=1912 RepID=UPI003A0FE281|nr:hypothetical protein [Streptomyces hygroscopicus]
MTDETATLTGPEPPPVREWISRDLRGLAPHFRPPPGSLALAGRPDHNRLRPSRLATDRDPDVFPDPDRIGMVRGPRPHPEFGNGPHYRTGAVLAGPQIEPLLRTLPDRLPRPRPAVPARRVLWRRPTMTRDPRALPTTWS